MEQPNSCLSYQERELPRAELRGRWWVDTHVSWQASARMVKIGVSKLQAEPKLPQNYQDLFTR